MRDSLPYVIFREAKKARRIDMEAVWEHIDSLPSETSQVMHFLYDEKGNPKDVKIKEFGEKFNMEYHHFYTRKNSAIRFLRHPSRYDMLLKIDKNKITSLEEFTTKELLEEIGRRINE